MKIIIAMRSLWACKILNGDKKIEVRKGLALYNALKKAEERGEEVEFLMYVTQAKPYLLDRRVVSNGEYEAITLREMHDENSTVNITPKSGCVLNGKVVAKFALEKYEKIYWSLSDYIGDDEKRLKTPSLHDYELADKACLEIEKLYDYFADGDSVGSALYISNLEIFDEPKTLANYGLKRAPQSWAYSKEAL